MSINSFSRPGKAAATFAALLAVGGAGGAATTALFYEPSTPKPVASVTTTSPIASTSSTSNASAVFNSVKQGVVEITATSQAGSSQSQSQSQEANPFGSPEGQGQQGGTQTAAGTGFVVDKQGHIVTNQHVVDGANSIEVAFADGSKTSAKVVGEDPSNDVAVIQVDVDQSKLKPLAWADSSKVNVGDSVYAIGSPYGLEGSFTGGIVSALGRSISSPNNYTISGAIQTDAPINHGNSGGPLLNSSGQVIGINSQIESDSGDNSGVGFAISANNAKSVAAQIIAGDTVKHPYLGVQLSDAAEGGATVGTLSQDSPAGDAGLKKGDTIVAVDNQPVDTADDVVGAVQNHKPGDKLAITVRRGGDEKTVTVTLGDRPSGTA